LVEGAADAVRGPVSRRVGQSQVARFELVEVTLQDADFEAEIPDPPI